MAVRDAHQLYLVPAAGGAPTAVPLPSGEEGAFSPDGTRMAYSPIEQWQPAWKQYRGGQTARIWVARLSDSAVTPIPRPNSNDRHPLWIGDKVYFLSDRDGPTTLYSYDPASGAVTRLVDNANGFDMAGIGAGPGGIVIDHFGALELYDIASGKVSPVPVTIDADLPQRRPHFEEIKPDGVVHARLSETGKRVILEARGEVLSAPAEKGDVRNITHSPAVADRDPAPSPMAARSPGSPTNPANMRCTSDRPMARAPCARSPWARRPRSSTIRAGRPTARRSCSRTSDSISGSSISRPAAAPCR
ncbi:hypothetical protein ACFS32_02730 [Novosphingobium pokkalii]|uniref:hypothetical protein n=1 Tax=Novosphingobium pokkalii TaxID=1770194 RepID=UPI003644CB8E